jgi:hypothetical protein
MAPVNNLPLLTETNIQAAIYKNFFLAQRTERCTNILKVHERGSVCLFSSSQENFPLTIVKAYRQITYGAMSLRRYYIITSLYQRVL